MKKITKQLTLLAAFICIALPAYSSDSSERWHFFTRKIQAMACLILECWSPIDRIYYNAPYKAAMQNDVFKKDANQIATDYAKSRKILFKEKPSDIQKKQALRLLFFDTVYDRKIADREKADEASEIASNQADFLQRKRLIPLQ